MAEHSLNRRHQVSFKDNMTLAKLPHYSSKIIHEAIEINLQENFDREGRLPV
jgi:hypothetical protein